MAIIKRKDAKIMSVKDRNSKINELKLELIKGNVTAQKNKSKAKEIRRTIARLLTFNKQQSEVKSN